MPDEAQILDPQTTGENQPIQGEEVTAPQEPDVLADTQAQLEQAESDKRELQKAIIAQMNATAAQAAAAQPAQKPQASAAERLKALNVNPEVAAEFEAILAEREKNYVPRSEYERLKQTTDRHTVTDAQRTQRERLEHEGESEADILATEKLVSKWLDEGKQLGPPDLAYDGALRQVQKARKGSAENDPTTIARKQKLEEQDAADMRGGARAAPSVKTVDLSKLRGTKDTLSWLEQVQQAKKSNPGAKLVW